VDPLGVAAISELARCFLEQLAPEVLSAPQRLDVLELVDTRLPRFGIHVCPASRAEIGSLSGATDPSGSDHEVTILVSEDVWKQLELSGAHCYYARTTVCHEIGHAILHVPILRRRLQVTNMLARTQRSNLPAYCDPEWQAWAFSGAVLMPTVTLQMLQRGHGRLSADLVSGIYEVSTQMALKHLKRLKMVP
jgi:uncharacterized protein DUF955